MKKLLILALGTIALHGCAASQTAIPAAVVTKTVNIATPVPCPALAKLGTDPAYADTDNALATASDIFETTRLLLKGRLQRVQRLGQYAAARVACTF